MTDPDDFAAALDLVIARTGVERYRHLCSEANTLPCPNDCETWRRWIRSEAMGEPSERAPAAVRVHYGEPSAAPCGGCGKSAL